MSTLANFIQHGIGSPSHRNQKRKRNKRNTNWRRKLPLFADDMILYIENPKDAIRKLLKLINECGIVGGYKTNMQKYPEFLYINNKRSERTIKETIPITTHQKE